MSTAIQISTAWPLSGLWPHLISAPVTNLVDFFPHTGILPLHESLDAIFVSETKTDVTVGVTTS